MKYITPKIMMDSTSVISQATHGIIKELATDYEVSLSRMYEILGKDNPYPKARRLIRKIARHNQEGARRRITQVRIR